MMFTVTCKWNYVSQIPKCEISCSICCFIEISFNNIICYSFNDVENYFFVVWGFSCLVILIFNSVC